MRSWSRRVLAMVLTAVLLWVGATVSAQMVGHLSHHAHHQSATHATALCTWLCAAGQGVESVAILLEASRTPAVAPTLAPLLPRPEPVALVVLSRGPPALI